MKTEPEKLIPVEMGEIYSIRMLVFMETAPQSNRYHQILLNQDEYIRTSATIGEHVSKDGSHEVKDIKFSEEEYVLPDLKDIHE